MKIINNVNEMKAIVKDIKKADKKIGFVPTMGYLHEGHLSLVKRARQENEIVILSIFVNPTQFGVGEDYEAYPRDMDRDSKLCEEAGVDFIFFPEVEEMYGPKYKTYVNVEEITKHLCGATRPIHFRGVTTVLAKLFNITKADRAYFGLKDFQQVAVVKQMVRDLNFDTEIVPCPIVREDDGLAKSSRNTYLSAEDRKTALILSQALFKARETAENGEKDADKLKKMIKDMISSKPGTKIDYVEIVSSDDLSPVTKIGGNIAILVAVKVGKVRLIDNVSVGVN